MRRFLVHHGFEVVRQDDSHLRIEYLSQHIFYWGVSLMRKMLPAFVYKQAKPGTPSASRASRQRTVDSLRWACQLVTLPAAILMRAYYYSVRGSIGDCLYTVAVKR